MNTAIERIGGYSSAESAPKTRPMILRWRTDEAGRLADGATGNLTPLVKSTMLTRKDAIRLLACVLREDRRSLLDSVARMPFPDALTFDLRCRFAHDRQRWFRLNLFCETGHAGKAFETVVTDITDLKDTEALLEQRQTALNASLVELQRARGKLQLQSDTLLETARELEDARAAAEEGSRVKSVFLSNMSHELRTPLNAIIGFSQIIKEQTFGPVGSPQYRGYATDIFESGMHLLELINEVLEYSKIEAGSSEIFDEPVIVPTVVDTVLRMMRDRIANQHLSVELEIQPDLPRLRADKRKLRQILINLVSNAIKFTGSGGTITVSLWARPESGYVIQVADTGIGIALEDIPKALGIFGQVDSSFSRKHEGTGLGLPLTKSFAEMHGGSLDLQSQPGTGTTITVRFPSERIVSGASPTSDPSSEGGSGE